jgi:hypothetical protein
VTCQRHCDAGNKLLEVFDCRSEYHGVDGKWWGTERERREMDETGQLEKLGASQRDTPDANSIESHKVT